MAVSPLSRIAKANGIRKIVVIDDAFAPVTPLDLDGVSHARFSDALSDVPARVEEVEVLLGICDLDPQIPATIQAIVADSDKVNVLWNASGHSQGHWLNHSLFLAYRSDVGSKGVDLDGLKSALKTLRCEVDLRFEYDDGLDVCAYQVIFLDVYLKNETMEAPALARAIALGQKILQARESGSLVTYPLVFLMSSRDGAEDHQSEFKKRTGLRADFFQFIRKDQIPTALDPTFTRLLGVYKQRQKLAHLLDEYWLSALRCARSLRDDLAAIEPTELALLHEAELGVEQAALPDYLSWLVSEYLGAKLLADPKVQEAGQAVPSAIKYSPFPGMIPLTSRLADMYVRSGMRLEVSDDNLSTKKSRVQLGDVFARWAIGGSGPEQFVLVVDQSCDLARPGNKTSVLCIQCVPVELDDVSLAFYRSSGMGQVATSDVIPLVKSGAASYYLAAWDFLNPITPKLEDLEKRKGRLKRIARFKAVKALARQEVLTSKIGRIGEEVLPPNSQGYKAKLILNGKQDFKREFDAFKESWASVVIVQGRHASFDESGANVDDVAKPKSTPAKSDAPSSKVPVSTKLSFTTEFSAWLKLKLEAAHFSDVQAKPTAQTLIKNLSADAIQRIALSSKKTPARDMVCRFSKAGTTMHVVFGTSVPDAIKSEPLILLLQPSGVISGDSPATSEAIAISVE
jgi:hypothetical protein